MMMADLYYAVKPLIPRNMQLAARRVRARRITDRSRGVWPVYEPAGRRPANWSGWPQGKRFAILLTHDVETAGGVDGCLKLLHLERERGFRSAFYFTPRRYDVSLQVRRHITTEGFEVGLHGLNHDGKLYSSLRTFRKRAKAINEYRNIWNVNGFSSPCSQHNLLWNCELGFKYAITTYDTDPFEPQGGGTGTVFPLLVSNHVSRGYVELPYTLCQDFTLFVLLKAENPDIWKRKLDWIAEKGGMAHLKTHPDYMDFENTGGGGEQYPSLRYTELLDYIRNRYESKYWHGLPEELADFCLANANSEGNQSEYESPDIVCRSCRELMRRKAININLR